MAHEWDSYFQNFTPVSSEPKTFRTSEPEESLPHHIQNFIGQQEFPNSTASLADPIQQSTFDTNYYSNSNIGNSSSDCVYETLFKEPSWQTDGEHMSKNPLLKCGDADIKNLATNGLSSSGPLPSSFSTELQGLKQNCELLATSLLEDYSDVSSCSDTEVSETQPSCKFPSTIPIQQPETDSTKKQSPSEWLFTHTESVTFANEINAMDSDSSKLTVGENMGECVQETDFSTKEIGSVKDADDKLGGQIEEQAKNSEKGHNEGPYSDISVSDSEYLTGMENHPDDMNEQITLPACTKTLFANMEEHMDELATVTKETCKTENEGYDNPNAIDQQKINTTQSDLAGSDSLQLEDQEPDSLGDNPGNIDPQKVNMTLGDQPSGDVLQGEEKKIQSLVEYSRIIDKKKEILTLDDKSTSHLQHKEKELESLCEESFNVQRKTKITSSSVHDRNMGMENMLSQPETDGQDNQLQPKSPQISHPLGSHCTSMFESNSQYVGSGLQLSKNHYSKTVVLDDAQSTASISDGHLNDASDEQSYCSNSDFSLNSNNSSKDVFPQLPCSSTDTNFFVKEGSIGVQEKVSTSSKCVASNFSRLDMCNEDGIPKDLDTCSQKDDSNHDALFCLDKDSGRPNENSSTCQQMSLHQSSVTTEQEKLAGYMSLEGMDTFKGSEHLSREVSSDSKREEETCILRLNSYSMAESEKQGTPLKSSLQMRKRLQPVVIIEKIEPVISKTTLYHCAVCEHKTHIVDHLIEHHHCQHSVPNFQFSRTADQYLMTDKSDKHLGEIAKQTKHVSASHMPKRKGRYFCSFCNFTFSQLSVYLKHMRRHTGGTPYKCNTCSTYFSHNSSLVKHKTIPGRCKAAKTVSPDEKPSDHEVISPEKHDATLQPPQVVTQKTPHENLPECHVKMVDVSKGHVCVQCGKIFSTLKKVKRHVYRIHKGKSSAVWQDHSTMKSTKKCMEKPTVKYSDNATEKHIVKANCKNETKNRKYQCPLCPRLFMYSYNRSRHLRHCVKLAVGHKKNRIGNRYRCPLCDATFSASGNRYRHIKSFCLRECITRLSKGKLNVKEIKKSKDNEKEKIPLENKQTKVQSNLTLENEHSYKCNLCPAVFQQVSGLYKHMKRHESAITGKIIKYKSSALSTKSKLTPSSSTKTDESKKENGVKSEEEMADLSLTCKYCEKYFHTLQSLKKHESCHRGERPYRCLQCARGFKKRVHLLGHKIVHQTIECTLCKKVLPNSRHLIQHANLYHKGKSLPCEDCQEQFQNAAELLRHLKAHKTAKDKAPLLKEEPLQSLKSQQEPSDQQDLQCSLCKEKFDDVYVLRKHCLKHITASCKCPFCNKTFIARRYLLNHMDKHTGEKPYSCTGCGRRFIREVYLKNHIKKCALCPKPRPNLVRGSTNQCSICSRKFSKKLRLLTHYQGHKLNTLRPCLNCGMYFGLNKHGEHQRTCVQKSELNNGSSSNDNADQSIPEKHFDANKPYSCTMCGRRFIREVNLKNHIKKCTQSLKQIPNLTTGSTFQCSICSRSFTKKSYLLAHYQGHKLNTLRCCSNCGTYFGGNKLIEHQKTCVQKSEHNNGSCSNGNASKIATEKNLNANKNASQSHASRMFPFRCPYCTRRFRFRSVLFKHSVTHTGVQPYPCTHCGQRFSAMHLQLGHEENCNVASKKEKSNAESAALTSLLKMPAHQEEAQQFPEKAGNQLKCKFCTKTFVKPRSLRRHILTHNEVNPYRCKACDSCFSRYDYLKVHQAHCKGKRLRLAVCIPKISLDDVGKGWQNKFPSENEATQDTFDCDVCSKRFPAQSKLSRHVTLFHTVKLFKCTCCDAGFSHEKSLKSHRKMRKCRNFSKETITPQETPATENSIKPLQESRLQKKLQPYYNKKHNFTCSYCPRAFDSNTKLLVHTRLHTGEKPFACDCGLRFIRRDYLQRHFRKCSMKQGNANKLVDNEKNCTKMSNLSAVGQNEEATSQSLKGFSCAYCSSQFSLFSQLQEHFLSSHKLETMDPTVSPTPLQHHLSKLPIIDEELLDDKQSSKGINLTCKLDTAIVGNVSESLVCQVCNMSFENKAGLKGHSRVHSKESLFKCKICKKGFWNKNLLRNHNRKCRQGHGAARHIESPLKADLDLEVPESILVFKDHSETTGTGVLQTKFSCKVDSHSPNEVSVQSSGNNEKKVVQYQCSECDLSFTDGLMLISHLEDHGREEQTKKLNTCPKCGRMFSNQAILDKHMKMHGLHKEFSCSDCPKSFYTSSELDTHKTFHDPVRPFPCKLCGQRFWSKQSLCYHYGEDHHKNTFSCNCCKKAYLSKKSLQRHYKECHPKERNNIQNTEGSSKASVTSESDNDGSNSDNSDSAPYFPCHVCGKTFPTSENLEDHQKCHLGEKPHECSECGRCFFQASQLEQHKRMHKSELQCQVCGRGFVSHFALRKHKHSHGKSRPHRCSKCQLSFAGPSQLAEHMSTHREENFPCDICNQVFLSKSSRAEHRKTHPVSNKQPSPALQQSKRSASPSESSLGQVNLKYRCGLCNERFKDPEDLSEHGCWISNERLFPCLDCNKHFLHASHLEKHKVIHQQSQPDHTHVCNHCNTTCSSFDQMLSHLKTHENEHPVTDKNMSSHKSVGTLKCKLCKMTFSSASKLEEHEQSHSGSAANFECTGCDQIFLERDALHQHPCTHQQQQSCAETTYKVPVEEEEVDVTVEENYYCPACAMPFSSKSALLEHQNTKHGNVQHKKQFKCTYCEKTFAWRHSLRNHVRKVHLNLPDQNMAPPDTKLLKCSKCSQKFNTPQELSQHMRKHAETEVGLHRCDMCYKSFARIAQLELHQESHVGQIVYECTECDKAFAFPHLLEEHQLTHLPSKQ
ncbi:zinc finger protein 1035 isoform X1 [Nerophis lumbriciformis]|uniref:zinc finger protein 1035 isoform X1 n=1 Tax=Nerophis lumbriciformis TaxID=546530 RepID=UPI002ADF80F3|nr:zinc finger protein 1035 [Nerophis lumbriciformis]XP_061808117.1 zinc finger protein 1035 [Nerophis lumbriciformis]XP_061808125.1 zinc finger protein 1035 [Nerophis lumbriciformis]